MIIYIVHHFTEFIIIKLFGVGIEHVLGSLDFHSSPTVGTVLKVIVAVDFFHADPAKVFMTSRTRHFIAAIYLLHWSKTVRTLLKNILHHVFAHLFLQSSLRLGVSAHKKAMLVIRIFLLQLNKGLVIQFKILASGTKMVLLLTLDTK